MLARELSLEQIRGIASAVTVPLEAFVHGALCVSYSGDCQASLFATGRSANRGECAQMCRLPYSLTDADGRKLAPDAHYLSLRDMNRLDRLADLADAGVSSFKIEGRLKESDYVRNTVAAYSKALDAIVGRSEGRYCRSSVGDVDLSFTPDVTRSFNRRFTSYFLDGRPDRPVAMASLDSPKWIGRQIGRVAAVKNGSVKVDTAEELANGDGLGYFDANGRYCGFRVNRVNGDWIYPASEVNLKAGVTLYRNRDKRRDDLMSGETARRTVAVDAELRRIDSGRIAMRLSDRHGADVEVVAESAEQPARTSQLQPRQRVVAKLGDTIYRLGNFDDRLPDDSFVAASVLADLRRRATDTLDATRRMRHVFDYRRPEQTVVTDFSNAPLDRHDNVANRLSAEFFADHGMTVAERAAEVCLPDRSADRRVMTTRYCLRRELGACLKTPGGKKLPTPMFLRAQGVDYRLDFDCAKCCMNVILPRRKG